MTVRELQTVLFCFDPNLLVFYEDHDMEYGDPTEYPYKVKEVVTRFIPLDSHNWNTKEKVVVIK